MPVARLLPTPEAYDLIDLVREIAQEQLAPRASQAEADAEFPRDVFTLLGRSGLHVAALRGGATAAAGSRTRSTSRCWRRSPPPG